MGQFVIGILYFGIWARFCKKTRYFLRKMQYLYPYRIPSFPNIRTTIVTVYRKFQKCVPLLPFTAQGHSVLPYFCRTLAETGSVGAGPIDFQVLTSSKGSSEAIRASGLWVAYFPE